MDRQHTLRIAVRDFQPFSSAIRKQWEAFHFEGKSSWQLEITSLDLESLEKALFDQRVLERGDFDIAFVVTDWIGAVHASQSIIDLSPFLAANPPEGYPEDWEESLWSLQTIDGAILGVPYHNGPECLLYRKDLFEDPHEQQKYQAIFSTPLRVPETWQEFHQVAQFFHRPQQGLYGTVFAAYPDGHNTVYDFLLLLWTHGGNLFDKNARPVFLTSQAAEAMSFYRSLLRDTAAVHPDCLRMDSVEAGKAFFDGKIAMMVNWFGFGSLAETRNESCIRKRIDIAPIPHVPGAQSASLSVYWVCSIAKRSPHPSLAYEFLRHCLSLPMDKLLTLEGGVGCRKSTWEDAEVNRTIPLYRQLKGLHSRIRHLPRIEDWPKIAGVINDLVVQITRSNRTIEELLEEADAACATLRDARSRL